MVSAGQIFCKWSSTPAYHLFPVAEHSWETYCGMQARRDQGFGRYRTRDSFRILPNQRSPVFGVIFAEVEDD